VGEMARQLPDRPLAYRLVPQLLAVCALLTGANWYLRPEAMRSWLTALMFLAVMGVVFLIALDWRDTAAVHGASRQRGADSMAAAIVFACLMIGSTSLARAAATLGTLDDAELGTRAAMAVFGIFLMFTGNTYPKALSPIGACSGARTQAFQRLVAWTWVVVGLAYALVWLRLPIDVAEIVGPGIILGGALFVLMNAVRSRWGGAHSI
jgi:hypothetical protein